MSPSTQDTPRQSPRHKSLRRSPRRAQIVLKISDFFKRDKAKKQLRDRQHGIKYRAQRAVVSAPPPPPIEPSPPHIPSKRALRTKAERRASKGRKTTIQLSTSDATTQPSESVAATEEEVQTNQQQEVARGC
jgi:hypothetical protein